MPFRIEIISTVFDTRTEVRKKNLHKLGFKSIKKISIVDVYTIDKRFKREELQEISDTLINPIVQRASVSEGISPPAFSYALEISFLPGVTDNIANTAKEIITDKMKVSFVPPENVYTSQITFITGDITSEEANKIADSLYNPLIQHASVVSYKTYKKQGGMPALLPVVRLNAAQNAEEVNLNITDSKLKDLGKRGIIDKNGKFQGPLALDFIYMKTIQDHFRKLGRNPTDIELESIAQTWSEHCKHTIFADPIDEVKNGLYKTFIQGATHTIRAKKGKKDFCVSVFHDNSGAIEFDRDYLITHKVETHNSPSALDPFGGAVTGIVGVNRDAIGFGLGAKPVANTYGFCFGNPDDTSFLYRDSALTQPLLSPRRIMDGVVAGVNSGGNCSGIPTPLGFVFFDNRYKGKPLVFVGTVGLIPKKIKGKPIFKKKAQRGDYIVMVGGRVGKDGIHGATFSSEALSSGSPVGAVQIGDPITQKKLSDALVKEARDKRLYTSITDNGAGGLSCSVSEMARESGGAKVELEKVPLKYPGLSPWEIWISESQERMTLSVPKRKWKELSELLKRRGVEASIIGTFTTNGKCIVTYHGKKIMDISMNFLHNGLPPRPMKTTPATIITESDGIKEPKNYAGVLENLLSRFNIAGFSFISEQFDHEVGGGSVTKPLVGKGRVNADAVVFRPLLTSKKGVVISQATYPTYSDTDTYRMTACSIDTAIRNAVTVGANPEYLALLDNFCWSQPDNPEYLYKLKKSGEACYDYAVAYQTPFIAGKDSMYNDFKGFDGKGNRVNISVPPTLLISSLGIIEDIEKSVTPDIKYPGDLIYLLGDTQDELTGSEYYSMLSDSRGGKLLTGNRVPKVDAKKNSHLYRYFYDAIQKDLISSAISVGRGGIAVALAKKSMAGRCGVDVSLKGIADNLRTDTILFSESQGRIILTIDPKNKMKFENVFKNISHFLIGKAREDNKCIIKSNRGETIVNSDCNILLKSYRSTFKDY
ncbi:phosphoribosylformylglycinamidine synthase II [Candidatus Gottesmanbacteria bacterium RIFCSPHIGHO2_02_FULL_39_11]|uniref:Phosphoribosylformylglycinamidine synthase subunit PurL n=1 Tax=Candidatus Gottesmanbacteria bacterium RIFCSPHIGHO2_02_FULL_39_11 TaxID=1798382 RepID=A0A1F5ZWQ2_9BACT|nr:MAG: phosphoribosylformylglycinamidine synthase II [Candidatus Gottesmanbacteria bacterium RIFCSPHIGHO2_02_FULL_39_11]